MSDDFFEGRLGPEDYTTFDKPKAKPNYSEMERKKAEAAAIVVLSADEAAEADGAETTIDGVKHRLAPVQLPDGSYFLPKDVYDAPQWSAARSKVEAKRLAMGAEELVRTYDVSRDKLAEGDTVMRPSAVVQAMVAR